MQKRQNPAIFYLSKTEETAAHSGESAAATGYVRRLKLLFSLQIVLPGGWWS